MIFDVLDNSPEVFLLLDEEVVDFVGRSLTTDESDARSFQGFKSIWIFQK